ncbi:MAG: phytoene dehydrogenase [Flavobacteriales bacterium]|nr:phytoene dehydrogenase [Flavobacteriales bacterium]
MKKAIVIGAGIGGIAASIRLQSKGYQVAVFEANSYPGGKLTQIGNSKYRFDAGPSLFTMPEKVIELLNIKGGESPEFQYQKLDEVCRYFYEDGTVVKGLSNGALFAKEIKTKLGVSEDVVKKHLSKSKFIFNSVNSLFLEKSLHKLRTYFSFKTLFSFLKLPFLNIGKSMNEFNEKHLDNSKLVQLFNRYATYNGSNPYEAPAILNLIPHLEFGRGAFYPKKGMHSITQSLYEKAISLDVKFYFNSKVTQINTGISKIKSIEVDGRSHEADVFVSNMDVVPFYKNLLRNKKQPKKVINQERSSSALIFYWGIKKEFKKLILHNILFSNNYKDEFDYIFNKSDVYYDPTIYINISSKLSNTDAPKGNENWFVMINVPRDKGQNWDELIAKSKKNIISKINRNFNIDLEHLIEFEEVLDPRLIEKKTGSFQGSLYGTSSNSKKSAFFRHPNFSKDIKNLYFCGGSVHPGGGIPLALSSAKILSELVD